MNKIFNLKIKYIVLSSLLITASCMMPAHAAKAPKDKINEWIHSCPYIGLVAKEVSYGPITLKGLDLEDSGRVIIVKPNEEIEGTVKYTVDSDDLDSLKLHHIIIGIKGQDGQDCLTHTLGVWDKKGKAHFKLIAPAVKGVYEIRFDYQTALTCGEAINGWRADPPSSQATVGIIIVE